MLKNPLFIYISSNLNVNIMSAISLHREKYVLLYNISLFMKRRLVPEISLFSLICSKPPYSILKDEHIDLSPQLRMSVRLAAQILSNSMANALRAKDDPHLAETAIFCEIMDKWFDCLNGQYFSQDIKTRKPELAPYTSKDDWRFRWLAEMFLGLLEEWENDINTREELSKLLSPDMSFVKVRGQ